METKESHWNRGWSQSCRMISTAAAEGKDHCICNRIEFEDRNTCCAQCCESSFLKLPWQSIQKFLIYFRPALSSLERHCYNLGSNVTYAGSQDEGYAAFSVLEHCKLIMFCTVGQTKPANSTNPVRLQEVRGQGNNSTEPLELVRIQCFVQELKSKGSL